MTVPRMHDAAILVVDAQQAFCEEPLKAFEVDRVIACINGLAERARAAGVPVLFVQHEAKAGPFARTAATWRLAEGLRVDPTDLVVAKKASDAFHETGLAGLLRERGARRLVVCGMQSDYCVDSTVRRALALGFDVRLVEDALSTVDNGVLAAAQITAHHVKTLTGIASYPGQAVACKAREALALPQSDASRRQANGDGTEA